MFVSGCVRVCVSAPEAINNLWRDMNLIRLDKHVLHCYMATVVVIINGSGLDIDMRHGY